ncbi:MAG: GAF domain-containing protein [Leptolyngbya sp. BL-A-14]
MDGKTHPASESDRVCMILERIMDGFFVVDQQWRVTSVNQQAVQILQAHGGTCTRELLMGANIWQEFPEVAHSAVYQELHRAALEQIPVKFEAFYPPLQLWVEMHAYPEAEGLSVYFQDITERRQAEAALRQQADRERLVGQIVQNMRRSLNAEVILSTAVAEVRQFLQTDRVLIYQFDAEWSGTVVVESVSSESLLILGRHIHDPCFANWAEPYRQGRTRAIADIYSNEIQPCHAEFLAQFQVRANLVVPILQAEMLWGLLIAHHCHAPRQWQAFEIDLLNQIAAQVAIAIQQAELYQQVQRLNAELEQQVQERTAQLKQALECEALLKRITDKVRDSLDECQILRTVVAELGVGLKVSCDVALYSADQSTATIACEYLIAVPPSEGFQWHLADFPELYTLLPAGQSLQFCAIPSGWVRPVAYQKAILMCPIIDDQGVLGDLALFRPRTAVFNELEVRLVQQVANQCAIALRQARLYQTAQSQVQELEQLHAIKDDFLSTVSHELRTPLTNIRMAIQMLELDVRQNGLLARPYSKTGDYLNILRDECRREANLIDDLLDLQRLSAGTQPLHLEPIQLQTWLPQLVKPFAERMKAQQQMLQLELSDKLPALISDVASLGRIISELLNNACKYTPPTERIIIEAKFTSPEMQIKITNTGVEISAHELPHIFDKFYRIPHSDRWNQGGTGLGLALVKVLVERLGGTITVESTSEQTSFTINIKSLV